MRNAMITGPDVSKMLDKIAALQDQNRELLEALELACNYMYNGFEPDNQSHVYKHCISVYRKAMEQA